MSSNRKQQRQNSDDKEIYVRVAVRVRPLLPKEQLNREQQCVRCYQDLNQIIIGKDRSFTFDQVFMTSATQQDVFDGCISGLVKRCLDGYNATVFAYGQTGSGKTFTIGGGDITTQNEDDFGIIPRAINEMFELIKNIKHKTTVRVSYVEIYMEDAIDLLDLDTSKGYLLLQDDEKGNTVISNAREVVCTNADEVLSCLEQGSATRHTAATQMNDKSSRSHSIFTVNVEQTWFEDYGTESQSDTVINPPDQRFMTGKFHFVDLAGSERAHRTGNRGSRFKESITINSGLLALGNVICALSNPQSASTLDPAKKRHIPYRDSKITRILKDSLGGSAHTVMICCISPTISNMDETLNSLKYANRARNIANVPVVNIDPHTAQFKAMQTEIDALREKLERQTTMGTIFDSNEGIDNTTNENELINEMETQIQRLRTKITHYDSILEEAQPCFEEILQEMSEESGLAERLHSILDLMDEVRNRVPSTLSVKESSSIIIINLKKEISQLRSQVRADEEIFHSKNVELHECQSQAKRLEELVDQHNEAIKTYEAQSLHENQLLVEKQVQIDQLQTLLKEQKVLNGESVSPPQVDNVFSGGVNSSDELPLSTERRAKSVPAHMLADGSITNRKNSIPLDPRDVHTSPALFSLERVMAGFRARSRLLLDQIEEADSVQTPELPLLSHSLTDLRKSITPRPAFERNSKNRGTYKVKKSKLPSTTKDSNLTTNDHPSHPDAERLTAKQPAVSRIPLPDPTLKSDYIRLKQKNEQHHNRLKNAELVVRQSTQNLKEIDANIHMKKNIIEELKKSKHDAELMSQQYKEQIKHLEEERSRVNSEMKNLSKSYLELESKEKLSKEKQSDYARKLENMKSKLQELQKQQKEKEKLYSITGQNDKRVLELEMAVDKMRQQQENLKRRLQTELDRKLKLEREFHKEHQRIKDLETKNEQQKRVLKVKSEELSAVQKRLRSGTVQVSPAKGTVLISKIRDEQVKIDEQKQWLENEIEKMVSQRTKNEQIQKELLQREDTVAKREAMLQEKSELEMKRLRSSQILNKDINTVSSKLDIIDKRIDEKTREFVQTPRAQQSQLNTEIQKLEEDRKKLIKQQSTLDENLREGRILSPKEERRLIELEEAIETIDTALEYKTESISSQQNELRQSVSLSQNEDGFMFRLNSFSSSEIKSLLTKYFEKIVDLKENELKKTNLCSEYEVKIDEQDRLIKNLDSALQRSMLASDHRLSKLQYKHEQELQLLMQQINTQEGGNGDSARTVDSTVLRLEAEKNARITTLERELLYYKTRSREFKKKLNSVATLLPEGVLDGEIRRQIEEVTPRGVQNNSSRSRLTSAESDRQVNDTSGHVNGVAPVRISRRDLRRVSNEEVELRRSGNGATSPLLQSHSITADSIEVSDGNPWK